MSVRVIVCGGRMYPDEIRVSMVLGHFMRRFTEFGETMTIIHGGAPGADTLAGRWAKLNGVACEVFPAQWAEHGKSAGPRRNQKMLDAGANLVIAFPGGAGTAHMVRIAKKAGISVHECA